MTWRPHQTAQQRRRGPLDGAQIAPQHPTPPNACGECQHVRLIHGCYDGHCLTAGCGCREWVEP